MVSVHGKMILAGEHSVVYGHTAVAAPVTLAVTATSNVSGRFVAPALALDLDMGAAHPMLDTLRSVLPWDRRPVGAGIELGGTLPPGLGLGFSAALSVAVARLFCDWLGKTNEESKVQVRAWAHALENTFHGGASGLDVEAVLVPYALEFRRGAPIEPINVEGAFELVGAAFPVMASTKECVAQVRAMCDADAGASTRIEQMGALALAAADCLRRGDDRGLGDVFNRIHEHLVFFGLGTAQTHEAVQAALQAGAYGVKISGAGGGGLVLAVVPLGKAAAVENGWRQLKPKVIFKHVLS